MRKRRYPSIFDAFEGLIRGFPSRRSARRGSTETPSMS
jgi:hypothetical protein